MNEVETTLAIQMKRIAVTLLDMEQSRFVSASQTMDLSAIQSEVYSNFFESYIDATLNSPKSVACKFLDRDNDIITKINRYVEYPDDTHFISLANDLSNKLYQIMQNVSNSNGSVFVAHIEIIDEPYILFLKLDPKEAVQIDLETLNLTTIENILPDASSRVQKCALIRMNYNPLEENVYVLDRQSDGEPAKFFMETFLQATPIASDKKKTKMLMKELYEKIAESINEEQTPHLQKVIDEEFENGKYIELDASVHNIYEAIAPPENRNDFVEQGAKLFINEFTDRNPDFTPTFEVKRDDLNVIYKSAEGEILFRYDKRLENIDVHHDQVSGTYTITIRDADKIDFTLHKKPL
ncbi:nucleoid-associated protein [Solibacillus sp. A46]|uniref:Nucleoid-associated protein n=1 Tax=Solibacillus faecavium TaxID=2762221 RepID=A0ABR8XVI3_9BACL|nr:nucleoid-associated protein [Solibacillus faecavium]MBD8035958.1 nucleoid-associated protein [Solibacillus faecavium]